MVYRLGSKCLLLNSNFTFKIPALQHLESYLIPLLQFPHLKNGKINTIKLIDLF